MDVDDLGKIFSIGLERRGGTFSRVASLSRLLNNFFKNCIRMLANGELSEHLPDDMPKVSVGEGKREIVVVYSGGDDLFIVGAWNHVFEIAFEIEALFRKYVGENPNITISAGYAIFDPKYPLYRMAEVTGNREEEAKEEGEVVNMIDGVEIKRKGRICLTDKTEREKKQEFKVSYSWSEFHRVWNTYITKIYDREREDLKKDLPRAVIRKILDARNIYIDNPKGFKWSYILLYYLSRAKYDDRRLVDVLGELAFRDAEKVRKKIVQDIYLVGTPLKIVDLAIRRG
jgi:CRISPR-associated protein Csm1